LLHGRSLRHGDVIHSPPRLTRLPAEKIDNHQRWLQLVARVADFDSHQTS
jgi:hypothetical protein